MFLPRVHVQSFGMANETPTCAVMPKTALLTRVALPSASTSNAQIAAHPPTTSTNAQDAVIQIMEPSNALLHRRSALLLPYHPEVWADFFSKHSLSSQYPTIINSLFNGFDLSILPIFHSFTPPNHHFINSLPSTYKELTTCEFDAGHYIGPFTCNCYKFRS